MSQPAAAAGGIELDANSVWRMPGQGEFGYSEGAYHEQYLRRVLQTAADLGSDSYELEGYIRDWSSKYHLSRKRSQLLRGFDFDARARVLEVGCGCGAITRFLGETFSEAVAVEGSLARATLARLRTKGLANVSIINAPFQNVRFHTRFGLVFCIGVLEYSKEFVGGPDPYDAAIRGLADLLEPDGALIVAIENQFGLKYFCSSPEDHTGVLFDGLEGYPRYDRQRTFGYNEIRDRLRRHFDRIEFYFPYPDYKFPSCVLAESALDLINAGEMIGKFASADRPAGRARAFDQKLVLMELARNGMLHLFSNSFLIVASRGRRSALSLGGLGVLFSDRPKAWQTEARIRKAEDGEVWIQKSACRIGADSDPGPLKLIAYKERWISSDSIQMQIARRVRLKTAPLGEIFAPARDWIEKIRSMATAGGGMVEGKYIDCLWSNSFVVGGECVFTDQEWIWEGKIRANILAIRSIYYLLYEIRHLTDLNHELQRPGTRRLIRAIGRELGLEITQGDLKEFCRIEADIGRIVSGAKGWWRGHGGIRMMLLDRRLLVWWERAARGGSRIRAKIGFGLHRWSERWSRRSVPDQAGEGRA